VTLEPHGADLNLYRYTSGSTREDAIDKAKAVVEELLAAEAAANGLP
jgi:predicted RNase H-like HicB family nuclease